MDVKDRQLLRQLEELRKLLEIVDTKSDLQLLALKQLIKVWSEHYDQQINVDRSKSE